MFVIGGREGSIGGRSFSVSKSVLGEVEEVENKSSMGSKLMASGEECLDGWVGADGKGLLGPNGGSSEKFEGGFWGKVGSCGGNGGREGSMFVIGGRGGSIDRICRGSLAKCSMKSNDGLGDGRFVVVVVKHLELMEELIDNRLMVREDDKEGTPVEGWRNNTDEHES
nr:hypothetical protein [Tanacetum cinerariifolium]